MLISSRWVIRKGRVSYPNIYRINLGLILIVSITQGIINLMLKQVIEKIIKIHKKYTQMFANI